MLKKWNSLLGAITLTATSGFSVISCQTNTKKDPAYEIPKKPATIEEAKELIGDYYDFFVFHKEKYLNEESPSIKKIDSVNWQKSRIFYFIADCENYLASELGNKEVFDFTTKENNHYVSLPIDWKLLTNEYDREINQDKVYFLTEATKKQITTLYNWATENNKF